MHAQIASILHATNLRYLPFMMARLIHGFVAAFLVLFLWEPVMGRYTDAPAFASQNFGFLASAQGIRDCLVLLYILLAGMTVLSLLISWIQSLWRGVRRTP